MGTGLMEALEQTASWRSGGPPDTSQPVPISQQRAAEASAVDNDQSLAALTTMLAGTTRV